MVDEYFRRVLHGELGGSNCVHVGTATELVGKKEDEGVATGSD